MNIKEIQHLIKFVTKSGVDEVEIEKKDFKIIIRTNANRQSKEISSTVKTSNFISEPILENIDSDLKIEEKNTQALENQNKKHIIIKSPIIGTFYRKPSPDKPNFVEKGSEVKKGDPLCVIEAMKLFNEIECEIDCKIIKILVDDETPVEFDQPLFLVDPS
ncbi:MAG: acetyl-CoA carboxylase, biotin carboxyl carrier protein [Flavobacteriaceae bacterium]|nr:acetyl-CoA carboxylase, biotin carboxyl carrier protein [Flavobacteriaceae bacterium]|tara:strand:+ start:2046 stop:2528 length:483 start_codon:yes stop_codon:yes gene_type:complete